MFNQTAFWIIIDASCCSVFGADWSLFVDVVVDRIKYQNVKHIQNLFKRAKQQWDNY